MSRHFNITEEVTGKWLSIYRSLGIQVREDGKHGKCPLCKGEKKFRIDDKEGSGSWICTCQAGYGWHLIQEYFTIDFPEACEVVKEVIGHCKPTLPREERQVTASEMRSMFYGASRFRGGDLIDKYLESRGLTKRPDQQVWHQPRTWHSETKKYHDAMLGVFQMPDGKAVSFHRTYLSPDGQKLGGVEKNKKMSEKLVNSTVGGCVRLFDAMDTDTLCIAEGIESALAAAQDFGLPCWAATSAVLLEKWEPPEYVKEIIVVGDNDKNFTGQKAAYNLANRLTLRRKDSKICKVFIPDKMGCDWLDVVNDKCGCSINQ